MIVAHHKGLVQAAVDDFMQRSHYDAGRWYKIATTDPRDGRLKMVVVRYALKKYTVLLCATNNMARTAIDTRAQITSLRGVVHQRDGIKSIVVGPASADDLKVYTAAWPTMKPLLLESTHGTTAATGPKGKR